MDSYLSQAILHKWNEPDWKLNSSLQFLISSCYPLHHLHIKFIVNIIFTCTRKPEILLCCNDLELNLQHLQSIPVFSSGWYQRYWHCNYLIIIVIRVWNSSGHRNMWLLIYLYFVCTTWIRSMNLKTLIKSLFVGQLSCQEEFTFVNNIWN